MYLLHTHTYMYIYIYIYIYRGEPISIWLAFWTAGTCEEPPTISNIHLHTYICIYTWCLRLLGWTSSGGGWVGWRPRFKFFLGIFSFFSSTFILFIQCSHSAHNSSREVSQFQATLGAPIAYGIWATSAQVPISTGGWPLLLQQPDTPRLRDPPGGLTLDLLYKNSIST